MENKPFRWLRWAVLLSLLLIGWTIFQPLPNRARENPRRAQCQSNLKQIALATKQYLQDNNERYPSLDTVAGWREALNLYVKSDAVFQCPSDENKSEQTADYWLNARMSGIREEVLDAQALTAMLGDGYTSADPRVSLSQMPQSWKIDAKSPAWRHLDGANYAFADGHVKWLRPEKITTQKPREGFATFALR